MKNIFLKYTTLVFVVASIGSTVTSCKYKDIVDTNVVYPDQAVYLSQAATATVGPNGNGIYSITPNVVGFDYRFIADVSASKLNIPMGVARSGVNLGGSVTVNLNSNTDTITKLLALGRFAVTTDPTITTEILPSTAFTVPATATVDDGAVSGTFNVAVDLNFLVNSYNNTPKKRYAFAIGIVATDKAAVSSKLSTAVVLIDPARLIVPVADFSSYVINADKSGNFINKSSNGVSYSWNYGDGTPVESKVSPTHVYAASGTYTVTLTTTGITGSGPAVVKTTSITIP